MEYAGNISGSKPHIRKYGVDGGVTINAGEPVLTGEAVADNGGVTIATTIAAVSFLGCALADAVSTDAQNADDFTDNVEQVATIINPDAMWRAKFSGGATEDTALTLLTGAASAAGTTVTGATDEFSIWGYNGANAGLGPRRATAAATVVVAFPRPIAAGDQFGQVPLWIGSKSQYPQLTTALTQIDASAAIDADNANFVAVDLLLRDEAEQGDVNSYALLVSVDHAFNNAIS